MPPAFFRRDAVEVARALLGKGLFLRRGRQSFLVEIVETEAYLGQLDPASHAFMGPRERNRIMFEEGGRCYVYLSYGINYCMNVVTGEKGIGEAVLLRAGAPLAGLEAMRKNRGLRPNASQYLLTNGPGKLCHALGIDLRYNGGNYFQDDFKIVDLGRLIDASEIGATPRIGISKAKEELLRFVIKSSPWLSRKL